jgi:outer membrane cobalamin receptor
MWLPLAQLASVVCISDAVTGAPVVGATVRVGATARVLAGSCVERRATADSAHIARAGFLPQSIAWRAAGDTVRVLLVPVARAPQQLAAQRVVASATPAGAATMVSQDVADARTRGASTTSALLALLPFTQLRTARGETSVSLRGARREQVVMTLDGVPLNDPATGVADVSDIPLAGIGSATVAPGADPVGAGLGATGGVIALTTRAQRLISLQTGAFGTAQLEAASGGTAGDARWQTAVSWRHARNDFAFVNDAGVTPLRETRTNNDEQRAAISASVVRGATQVALLASTSARGMVGPANVRAYDEDRARTDRATLRLQQGLGASLVNVGVRQFTLAYRDPTRPALNSRAQAWAADADWRGALGPGTWRAGAGADGLTATGGITQRRARAFAAYGVERALATRGRLELGARTDAVERLGLQPTGTLGVRWALASVRGVQFGTVARAAQAVRVPTLYDLYFSSPQRLTVKALAPERVTLDASGGFTASVGSLGRSLSGELLAVSRTTRNAIVWFPGNFGWSPANVGRETVRGVEARTAAVLGAWQLDGWLTRYDARLHTNGLVIPTPYVAPVAAGLRTQVTPRLVQQRVTLSANARYVGRRPYTAGPRNPFFELPDVWLVDGAVSHHRSVHRTDVLVTLALDNATIARWQSVRGFPMPGRSWSLGITVEPVRR